MYETYFGLSQRPFAAVPRSDQFFAASAIEAARQALTRCVERGDGVAVVIGPAGTGKSLLCQVLAEQFKAAYCVVVLCCNGLTNRRALLQAILYELGQPYRGLDEGELRLALAAFITHNDRCPQGLLLVVDEAERLPLRLLDEIRALTNLIADGQPRVRLVLAGGAILEERFASPKLESFSQRIVARCYLEGLNRSETERYIHAQIAWAGGVAEAIFPSDACEAAQRATDGVPRLINQLCDHSLLLTYTASRPRVDAGLVEEAWADLQQLPTPWNGEPAAGPNNDSIIEFGGLDDEPTESDDVAARSGAHEPDTLPMLRVTALDDGPGSPSSVQPLDRLEPLTQLRRIEDALNSLDDEFKPAGSIEPEVELIFSDPADPFSERFEEEEIIVEQNSVLTGGFARLATMPHDALATPLTTRPEVTLVMPEAGPVAAGVSRTVVSTARRTQSVPLSADATYRTTQSAESVAAIAEGVPAAPASGMHRHSELRAEPDDDRDMILVEEGYDDTSAPPPRPVTPVRHFEYRRLFARLRHG